MLDGLGAPIGIKKPPSYHIRPSCTGHGPGKPSHLGAPGLWRAGKKCWPSSHPATAKLDNVGIPEDMAVKMVVKTGAPWNQLHRQRDVGLWKSTVASFVGKLRNAFRNSWESLISTSKWNISLTKPRPDGRLSMQGSIALSGEQVAAVMHSTLLAALVGLDQVNKANIDGLVI